jgi:hypothetical protein
MHLAWEKIGKPQLYRFFCILYLACAFKRKHRQKGAQERTGILFSERTKKPT